ncbi:MAG: FtsX-like permease family protein [Bacteroidota bacterium]
MKANRTGSYGNNSYAIYVKLKPGADYAKVYPKIRDIEHTEKDNTNAMKSYVTLQPLQRWHLFSNYVNGKDTEGFLEYVRMFTIIGLLVLLIACINFINLTTARSEKRAREVGVRKAIGSQRIDLVIQFLTESFLLTLFAFVISLGFVQIALPAFNTLTGSKIAIPFSNVYFWGVMLLCVTLTALISGSRPAFYLSSFQPVKVLKGAMRVGKAASLPRKVLVVLQFSCSIALIISTVIIYQQVQHAKNRPSGYDLNRLMATDMNVDLGKNFTAIKNELIQKGIVESVTTATSPATDVWWHSDIDQWPGKNAGETVEMGTIIVSEDYFKTVGMAIKEGRNFASPNDTTSVVFNETAINRLRIKNPVNQIIKWGDIQYRIAGVVKDALMVSPFAPAEPTMFYCDPHSQDIMMYRLSSTVKTQDAIAQLTSIFNKYNPAYPYKYIFADENYAAKFKLEVLIGKLAGIFAALAILISCLGLFGLNFTFLSILPGNYFLSFSRAGYKTFVSSSVIITDTSRVDVVYFLSPNEKNLSAVTVFSKKPLIEKSTDGIVYNVQQDLLAGGGTAIDVLRKTPMVSVGQDESPSIRSSSNIRVFIDDKPSDMFAPSVADALRQIPAEEIVKVEVILYPSAKYDAEGTDGVINIITRKNKLNGSSGTMSLNFGQRNQNSALSLNMRRQKWIFNIDAGGYLYRNKNGSVFSREEATANRLMQQNEWKNNGKTFYSGD